MKKMRINLYSGPNAGKSTTAAWLFAELKICGYHIQLIDEYIKRWAYNKRKIDGFDQVYVFSKHMYSEEEYLKNNVNIITDCPLLLIAAYCQRNQNSFTNDLISLSLQFEQKYPSINIYLHRGNLEYQQDGRYENYHQAIEMDNIVFNFLKNNNIQFGIFQTTERYAILKYIQENL